MIETLKTHSSFAKSIWGLTLWAAIAPAFAGPAAIQTFDGQQLIGEIQFSDGQLSLKSTNGVTVKLAFTNLQSAKFNVSNPEAAFQNAGEATNRSGALPSPWSAEQIGKPTVPGSANFKSDVFTLEATGESFATDKPDSFFFVHQPLRGNGQIVARILSLESGAAGVMMRDSTATNALFAAMFAELNEMIAYRSRREEKFRLEKGAEGDSRNRPYVNLPRWVKLIREGDELRGFMSWDNGEHWENFQKGSVPMGTNIVVGVFTMPGDSAKAKQAQFDNVTVTQWGDNRQQAEQKLNYSVVLRNGTVITGDLVSADATTVKLSRRGRIFSVSTLNIARILFQKLATPTGGSLIPNRPGVLLARGDFLDGDFNGFDDGMVKISSVLFGVSSYKVGTQAKALGLRDIAPGVFDCEVRTTDGCVWVATAAKLDENNLQLEVPVIGAVTVPGTEISEITRNARAKK